MSESAHRHKKRFGQHFLHERAYIERIVMAVDPRAGQRIVEIGPGDGALTMALLARIGALTAIEIDRDLIPILRERAAPVGDLTIVEADALTVDLAAIAPGERLRLVGNLPYNISTPLLFHVLRHAALVDDMHFMLQKEVVDRMAAPPGSKTYGRLSVMLQARCVVQSLFKVPPGAFQPPPKVDSAIVRLVPRPVAELAWTSDATLDRVVRAAFEQRRKTLRNALSGVATADDFTAAAIDPQARAETLGVAQFVQLANHVHARTGGADA